MERVAVSCFGETILRRYSSGNGNGNSCGNVLRALLTPPPVATVRAGLACAHLAGSIRLRVRSNRFNVGVSQLYCKNLSTVHQ